MCAKIALWHIIGVLASVAVDFVGIRPYLCLTNKMISLYVK